LRKNKNTGVVEWEGPEFSREDLVELDEVVIDVIDPEEILKRNVEIGEKTQEELDAEIKIQARLRMNKIMRIVRYVTIGVVSCVIVVVVVFVYQSNKIDKLTSWLQGVGISETSATIVENGALIEVEKITKSSFDRELFYNIDFTSLLVENGDTVAWLKCVVADVDAPVVQSKDNYDYLYHDFKKQDNFSGWYFVDYSGGVDNEARNIIIYGHNKSDGSMFGKLKNYMLPETYNEKENLIVELYTLNYFYRYEMFSVFETGAVDDVYTLYFDDNDVFNMYLQEQKSRSLFERDLELDGEDHILTLSTCSTGNNNRLIVLFKRIEEYEKVFK
jgi:sortase B